MIDHSTPSRKLFADSVNLGKLFCRAGACSEIPWLGPDRLRANGGIATHRIT